MKRIALLLIIAIVGVEVSAQQEVLYNQYRHNMVTINPAYAGTRDAMNLSLIHI